jgi:D-amino-acid dehydrogenase
MTGSVVVVGGGVIGASCAYYLARAGWSVTVLDRGDFGKGCSHGNCGFVCPSHVLPLTVPGAVRATLKALLSRNAPFVIRLPRLDRTLLSWLAQFARRCNVRDMMEAGRALQALLFSSRSLYDTLMKEEPFDCEWEARGMLVVFLHQKAMEHHAETDRLLRESFDMGAERYDGDRLLELEPALKPGLAGGWLYKSDAHLRPDRLMASWRRVLEVRGVTIRERCEMTGLVREDGRARAVVTGQGEVPADAFVIATGAWTPLLAEALGWRVPIQPGKGYSITMPRPTTCPRRPLIFDEHRVAVTPWASGYRLGSTMEFAGYDTSLDPRRLQLLRDGAQPYLHEPYCEPVLEEWYGWRPMTSDSKPIIGPCPALANVLLAAGHNMIGVATATATGKLVAELLGGDRPHIDPAPFAATRF